MKLSELQRAFFARIAQVGEPDALLEREVRSHGALSASERLDLYSNMYFQRLLEVLRSEYPVVAALVGAERFEQLAVGYVRHHPSSHPSVDRFGAAMAEHLREPRVAATIQRSDLADVAELEWARSEVFTEADATPEAEDAFARIGPEAFAEARLTLVPALRVLTLAHDVAPVWHAVEEGERVPEPTAAPSALVVWRKGFEVFHAAIALEEARALRLALEGGTVAEICAAFESTPEPAQASFAALGSWLHEGMIARVSV